MTNAQLAAAFRDLAKLMEYHGENVFKTRSYTKVADVIKKANVDFAQLSREELLATEGVGEAIADKISELGSTGELSLYRRYVGDTPDVVLELLKVKGLGVKKVRQLVTELGVSSVGELKQAVEENRVVALKGFSTASQTKLGAQLDFFEAARGQLRYADALTVAGPLREGFRQNTSRAEYTGALRRQCNTVAELDFLCVADDALADALTADGYGATPLDEAPASPARRLAEIGVRCFVNAAEPPVRRVFTTPIEAWGTAWVLTTCTPEYLAANSSLLDAAAPLAEEATVFAKAQLPYCPAPQREAAAPAPPTPADEVIRSADIRGVVHAHTTASDGSATLEVLAEAVQRAGYSYLTVTDHSKAAGYANGLSIERLRQQGAEIAAYNVAHPDFRVFAGTECDILRDGRLDYPDDVLAELDIVIASVHSVLTMAPADATERLLTAIRNPYTTMLGHPTGRLLLSRAGYAPDMTAVLEACAEHEVVVEINASSMRLDLDWTYVPLAVELGVKLSINPDAHSVKHLDNIRYGVYAAQKAGLRPADCLNCLDADDFGDFLAERKRRRGIA